MDHPKKVLIFYASAGHGHEKAARAVEECLREWPGASVRCLDALALTPKFFGDNYKGSYLFMIRRAAWLWGALYGAADAAFLGPVLRPLRRLVNGIMAARLEKMIADEKPEAVVCTHFMPVEIGASLKKARRWEGRLVSVVTDYLPHAFWIADAVDLYAVAHDRTRAELVRRGVPESKIRVTGIPVLRKFSVRSDKRELRAKFGLSPDVFTALVTSGGAGVGHEEALVRRLRGLKSMTQTILVCGTNKRLFSRLAPSAGESLKVYGFVDNMDELMQASDVVIGKSGGLTMSESLALGVPMIVLWPVPGQESRNAEVLNESGAGYVASSIPDAAAKVSELAEFPEELAAFRRAAAAAGRPFSGRDVAEIAIR